MLLVWFWKFWILSYQSWYFKFFYPVTVTSKLLFASFTEGGTIHHTCIGWLLIITLLMIWWCNDDLLQQVEFSFLDICWVSFKFYFLHFLMVVPIFKCVIVCLTHISLVKLKRNFWNWKCQCKKKMYVNLFYLALTHIAIESSGWYNLKEHACSVPIMEWYLIVFYTEFTGGSKIDAYTYIKSSSNLCCIIELIKLLLTSKRCALRTYFEGGYAECWLYIKLTKKL